MLLLLSLIGSVNALDIDVPIEGESDMVSYDQTEETSTPTIRYTKQPTGTTTDRQTVLINCMLYWIQL